MRLLPLALLAVVAGFALVYTPTLISTGAAAKFAVAQAPGEDNRTIDSFATFMMENDTMKAQGADRFMLQNQVSSPYGVLIGPSIALILGLLAATASYIIVRRGLVWFRVISSPPV